jgi:UDP-N-acetylglucosamine--N-acetylmuramyl-(pentapeptide) pyrophosphoryl-undecaprenol N-acetylglucosamine transferase
MKKTPESVLRVVIAGGGTGGHLFPGIAVARALLALRPDARISFAGTAAGIEARVVPREGFELDTIRSAGLRGKSIAARARGAALLPASFVGAWRILSLREPQIVLGVGGYSSGPVVLTAALRRIPTLILEQNAVPGLTNRLLAPFVQAAAVTYEQTRNFFGSKGFVSGNPVRPEFLNAVGHRTGARRDDTESALGVLIVGGSQGAHAINMALVEAAKKLAAVGPRLRLTHQTGERDVEVVRAAYRDAGLAAEVEPFLFDIAVRLERSDLIVCRAGATTLAEITAAGKPSILVPLPSPDDHQRRNAEALAEVGAASVLLQSDLTGDSLADRILSLAADPERRRRMGASAQGAARPDAARIIAERALELVKSNR